MFRLGIAAYTLDDASSSVIREAMSDIQLVRSRLELGTGGIDGAVARYASGDETPDLLVVQSSENAEGVRAQLEALSGVVSPGTQLLLVGTVDSIDFYREIRDMGIGQYLLAPVTTANFLRAIKDVFGQGRSSARGRVIAVTGSKGGTGASTVSHNLAWSLARLYGKPVSLVDLDLHFGTGSIDFNHESRAGFRDALDVAANGSVVDESYIERLFSKESETLWLLASAPNMQDSSRLMVPDHVEAVLDTVARMSDFVVLDVPHLWNPATGNVLLMADEVVVVTEPSLTGLRNTQLMFEAIGSGKPQGTFLRYVINGVGLNGDTEVGGKDFSETVGSAPLLSFPWAPAVFRAAGAQGRMLGESKKNAKLVASFDELARTVAGRPGEGAAPAAAKKAGFLSSLMGGKAKAAKPKG